LSHEARCLVIDRHPMVRMGVRGLLAHRYQVEEATDGRDALDLLTALGDFDVAIVELGGGNSERLAGFPAVRALHDACPGLGIVAHGARAERHAATEAIDAGATAYVAKSSPVNALTEAVEAAAQAERFVDPAAGHIAGDPTLTRRQREILQHLADGHSTTGVARRLGLSGETVRTHTKAALARLEARGRAHAVAIALRRGLID
jgi:DNA-binding NarL/FixJ family response regulator